MCVCAGERFPRDSLIVDAIVEGGGKEIRTFFRRLFSAFSSFCALFACRVRVLAVNLGRWRRMSGVAVWNENGTNLELEECFYGARTVDQKARYGENKCSLSKLLISGRRG